MKSLVIFFWLLLYVGVSRSQSNTDILMADPTIFSYKGKYYLYGTNGTNSDSGFYVMVSKDLKKWKKGAKGQRVLERGGVFGTKGFWAPQVFVHDGKIYMAYTANEQIAIARADSPEGTFTQSALTPLKAPVKQIDPYIFRDDDGKLYLYHVRLQQGNRIFVAEMKPDLSAIEEPTLQECITAVEPWENTANSQWSVAEGPTVFKKEGLYYLLYSANDFRNPDYAVGFAVAKHPLGPWQKIGTNPLLSKKQTGWNGSGHGDLVVDKKGNWFYVFHTHQAATKVAPRRTAIIQLSWKLYYDTVSISTLDGSFRFLKMR